jgi:hypothetical protein
LNTTFASAQFEASNMQVENGEYFLKMMREAEENAAKAPCTLTRNGWLNVATGYRDLARSRGAVIDLPSEGAPTTSLG